MSFTQYGDYFYLYILALTLLPAIVLGMMGKNIKYYGMVASIFMIVLIIGRDTQLTYFIMFMVYEVLIIKLYEYLRKINNNKSIYRVFLLLSMLPIIVNKLSPFTKIGVIGFIGISYLNFRTIQIIIELYDGAIKEIKLSKLIYFIIFFPTLSSGPIDRSRRFEGDLNKEISKKEYINDYLTPGIRKIIMGIGYKFVIALLINSYWMDNIPKQISFINSVNYMYAYSLYLFFDFAGYSLFAIGTSYILGIKVIDNFNKPFISKDMKEFWTRWHISLSKWFGDYIFSRFVIDSMRKKRFKNRATAGHVAQMITMFIMGLWHGLTWYYIVYGLYQGIVLVLTDMYQKKSKFYKKNKKKSGLREFKFLLLSI